MHIALWYTVYFVTNSYTTQDGNMNFVISQISIVGTPHTQYITTNTNTRLKMMIGY